MVLQRSPSVESIASRRSRRISIHATSEESLADKDLDKNTDVEDSDDFCQDVQTSSLSHLWATEDVEERSSFLSEITQAELALWTFALSILFTKLWSHRRTCLLIDIFIVTPVAIGVTAALSGLLVMIVVVERIFWSEKARPSEAIQRPSTPAFALPSRKTSSASLGGLSRCIPYDEQFTVANCRKYSLFNGNRPPLSRKISIQRSRASSGTKGTQNEDCLLLY